MFENEEALKTPLKNTMQIAIVHPSSQEKDYSKKILEKVTPEFKGRLKFTNYTNYKDIYKDLNKLPFIQEGTFRKGLLNENWIEELYNKRPGLIMYFYLIPNGADKNLEEKKIYENIAEIKKYDELVYIVLFIISKDQKENPYNFNIDVDKPYNLRKIIPKELIYEFIDDDILKYIDITNMYNTILHYTRLYYRVYKIKIKDKKIKSTSREEKIECNIMLGVLSIIKSKKLVYNKSKYLEEAYSLIKEKNFIKAQLINGDKSKEMKFNLNEIREIADWLFYKIMNLKNINSKNTVFHSLIDLMGKQPSKNKNNNSENDNVIKYNIHIKSFSFVDIIANQDKNDNFILIEYYWLLQRYKDLTEILEENSLNNMNKKKIVNMLTIYLKQIFYYFKIMKFYSKKNLDNPNVTIKNKETNINRIETEKNMFYGKPPNYSLKDINNPLVKFDIGFNEDIYIKKFVALKKINYNGPLKELYEKYINKIPNLLKNLRLNVKNINFCGGIDLYMNLLKICLLENKIQKENKNTFGDLNITMNDDIFNILNDSDYMNISYIKKFPKIYSHYLEIYIKSLIYNINNQKATNNTKTKLFVNLSLIGNIRKLKEEEENIFFQLINDESFIPEISTKEETKKPEKVIIKFDSDKNNSNNIFSFNYKLKDGDGVHEKKILDLVQYDFQLKTNLSKENIKLNNLKVYILCINEDEYIKDKNNKKEIIIKEYTKDELSSFDLNAETPINLEHKIFMKYKKGKIYLTQVEFSLVKKENIIYKIDLPINLNKMIFITNLNKKVLDIKIPKEKLTVGLNQYNKFDVEVNKEEIDEVQISQFKMSFISIPSYYKKSVPSTSMKALLTTKNVSSNKSGGQTYSSKVTEQIFGLSKTEKKIESLIGLMPSEKSGSQSSKALNSNQSSMQNFLYKNQNENKQNLNNSNNNNTKTPMFPSTSTKSVSTPAPTPQTHIPSEIIQVPMPSPIFYYYNEESNSLDNAEKNLEKEFNDFETRIKEGKNKFGVLLKFSLAGQYEIKLNISYSIRHRDIEDYIWFSQEETLKFIVIEPFKLSKEIDSSYFLRKTKINAEKKEEKLTEFFTDQKVKMNIVLTNQLNEDIIIKDIIIKLNEEILGEKNKEIKLKCPTKDIIDSESLPVEIKNQILKIIRMADYNIPFETNFNGEFKGSVGKFILKWTTPSLLNYENGKLETTNESIIDFPDLAITSPKLKFNYNTFNNENNEVLLNINIANVSNKSVKINFIIESGKEIEFIVSGVTKQVHNINANEFKNLIFRLIPLIRNDELKLPTIKIIEKDSESLEKICSYYYLLDKIYTI